MKVRLRVRVPKTARLLAELLAGEALLLAGVALVSVAASLVLAGLQLVGLALMSDTGKGDQ